MDDDAPAVVAGVRSVAENGRAQFEVDDGAELLLVDLAFADGRFVSELTNCRNEQECERRGVPWELVQLYRKLRWCGQTIDLDRFAAKSFQGWDCWGKGRPPGPAGS